MVRGARLRRCQIPPTSSCQAGRVPLMRRADMKPSAIRVQRIRTPQTYVAYLPPVASDRCVESPQRASRKPSAIASPTMIIRSETRSPSNERHFGRRLIGRTLPAWTALEIPLGKSAPFLEAGAILSACCICRSSVGFFWAMNSANRTPFMSKTVCGCSRPRGLGADCLRGWERERLFTCPTPVTL